MSQLCKQHMLSYQGSAYSIMLQCTYVKLENVSKNRNLIAFLHYVSLLLVLCLVTVPNK